MNRPVTDEMTGDPTGGPTQSPPPPALFAVGGCKGGVGKTMVALALVDYLLRRDWPILLVETDTSNPDVWRDAVAAASAGRATAIGKGLSR